MILPAGHETMTDDELVAAYVAEGETYTDALDLVAVARSKAVDEDAPAPPD